MLMAIPNVATGVPHVNYHNNSYSEVSPKNNHDKAKDRKILLNGNLTCAVKWDVDIVNESSTLYCHH